MNGVRKALPPRPSEDIGYVNPSLNIGGQFGGQNGYDRPGTASGTKSFGQGQDAYDNRPRTSDGRKSSLHAPNAAVILEGYRGDIMTGFETSPRLNPLNATRPQSSMLLNVNDPIQVHLLVETALGDSKEFEIISQEEVDDLKKQVQALTQRIEQTRQNLAIQSKYRDAAISMSKLYSPSHGSRSSDGSDKKRRSILGHRNTNSMQEVDAERLASEKRCEELAAELWSLEKRLIEPQHRLLKHTAGILQMTHKGPKKIQKGANGVQQGGMPGSPESMFTYSNARTSLEPIADEMLFDERSLYRPADRLDPFGDFIGRDSLGGPPPRSQARDHMQMITKTEQKLEDLNSRLRDVIVKANPTRGSAYSLPPLARTNVDGKPTETGETLQSHLDYLEKSIAAMDQEHSEAIRKQQDSEEKFEETVEGMNQEVHHLLLRYDEDREAPPQLTGIGLQKQLRYFQDSMGEIEMELSRNQKTGMRGNIEQTETVLLDLWDVIKAGEEQIRKQKQERRMTRSVQGLADDDDDISSDEDSDPNETFSLHAFSSKVQWLFGQATRLKDQKKVLQRQIKQQRELNSKSDATKDAEMSQKIEELERTKNLLTRTEMDADSVREQLSLVMEKLDAARQQELLRDQSRAKDDSAAVREAQEELDKRNATIFALEEELQELKDDYSISEAEIHSRASDYETRITTLTAEIQSRSSDYEATIATMTAEIQSRTSDHEARVATLTAEIQSRTSDHEARIATSTAEIQSRITDSEARIATLTAELAAATTAQTNRQALLVEKDKELHEKEKEIEYTNMKLAELQTEVTIARAELDGAYGTRAQRAAEVAANPAIQKEIDDLMKKNASLAAEIAALKEAGTSSKETDEKMNTLKKELQETIEEYELMTKASIEWEKEREMLEGTIDKMRDEKEGLESQLNDEKVRWLGMRSPVDGQAGAGSTSTTVLKNEFKKMMRDTRAENQKAIRAEQAERRRLEDELRVLKRQQGPGKSSLSQSIGSS